MIHRKPQTVLSSFIHCMLQVQRQCVLVLCYCLLYLFINVLLYIYYLVLKYLMDLLLIVI